MTALLAFLICEMPFRNSSPFAKVDPSRPSPQPLFLACSNDFLTVFFFLGLNFASSLNQTSTSFSNAPGFLDFNAGIESISLQNCNFPPATNAT